MNQFNLLRRAALLLSCIILTACAATQAPREYEPGKDEKNGVVVFSVSHDLEGGARNKAIVYLDGGVFGGRNGRHYMSSEDVFGVPLGSDFEGVYGRLYVLTLPAGDHEFTIWKIRNGTGLEIYPRGSEPQTFHVTAGQVKYLGNFHGNLVRGKNFFGITITGNGVVAVNDERTRDLEQLFSRYPQFKGKVDIDPLRLGLWAGPLAGTQTSYDPAVLTPSVKTK